MRRNRIKITESDLHKIIRESVKRVLNEAGHLYWEDDEGNPYTNSKELYRNVPGAIYVSHGQWSDPEIIYKRKAINLYDIEDSLWTWYNDFMRYADESKHDDFRNKTGMEPKDDDNDTFEAWIEYMGGASFVQDELDDFIDSMNDNG